MKILLIGNAPNAVECKLGKAIDEFPLVVRFNCYKLKGFEEYVGTKTDIWVATDYFKAWHKEYKDVYVCSFNRRPDNKIYLKLKEVYPDVKMFPEWAWQETIQRIGYNAPSTGAVATTYFSKNYEVYLYGFNFFEEGRHHYGDEHKRGTNHKPEYERPFFEKLLEEGTVKVFNNYTIAHMDKSYGIGGNWYRERILKVAKENECKSILDYGCGKGSLVTLLNKEIPTDGYDPYSGFLKTKEQYDMIVSTDFFEHTQESELEGIAEKMLSFKPKVMYHSISNRKAVKILPDGRNAHSIVQDKDWWKNKLGELFKWKVDIVERNENNNFTVYMLKEE